MRVRRLRADEWARWREFRLAMFREAPSAFGMAYAEAVTRPDEEWRTRTGALADATDTVYFLAEEDGEWLAGAGGYTEDGVPSVFGVWTRPDVRGRGYADACVRAVVEWARGTGAAEIRLWATDGNDAAERVYARLGFVATGARQPLPSDPVRTESEYALPL